MNKNKKVLEGYSPWGLKKQDTMEQTQEKV